MQRERATCSGFDPPLPVQSGSRFIIYFLFDENNTNLKNEGKSIQIMNKSKVKIYTYINK